MLRNLLFGGEAFSDRLGDGALMLPMGLVVVFVGMTVIILAVMIAGYIMSKAAAKKADKLKDAPAAEAVSDPAKSADGEIPLEVKAAIIAAISAYYFAESEKKCDFVVKKIKRL